MIDLLKLEIKISGNGIVLEGGVRQSSKLVRFAHNWNNGTMECWNNGSWENGNVGYHKIYLYRELNN